jgi:putative hemolysin
MMMFVAFALAQSVKSLSLYNGKSYDKIQVTQIEKLWVNDICVKNKKCQALETAKTKKEMPVNNTGLAGNPASTYCLANKGVPRILKDEKRQEYDYCIFKDGSLVDSWDLYSKHYSPPAVK